MKNFTKADLQKHSAIPGAMKLYAERSELVQAPTAWQKRGLSQTASGYGAKLNTGLKISYEGKLYRLYSTCYSNSGSVWFTVRGLKVFVS